MYDAPCWFRRYASTKREITAWSLAQKLVAHAFEMLTPEIGADVGVLPEIFVLFDTQVYMPPQRAAVAAKRSLSGNARAARAGADGPVRQPRQCQWAAVPGGRGPFHIDRTGDV